MNLLEDVTEKVHDAYFVDLFVRASNTVAIGMYVRPPSVGAETQTLSTSIVSTMFKQGFSWQGGF
jgi:ribosomal protein S18 acetylase RimI-like enzyme